MTDSVIHDAVRHGHDVSVCRECAIAAGGRWPVGHLATAWMGECRSCGEVKGVCATTDWEWPGRSGRIMQLRREG